MEKVKDGILYSTNYFLPFPVRVEGNLGSTAASSIFCYLIVSSFQHWNVPHHGFPEQWTAIKIVSTPSDDPRKLPALASGVTNYVNNGDERCDVSKHQDHPQQAHLYPRSETVWFQENCMEQYKLRAELEPAIDDVANSFLLRSNIHTTFDRYKMYVFARKQPQWAVYFLEPTMDLKNLYHNTPITLAPSISPHFILARFAWAILPRPGDFLKTN